MRVSIPRATHMAIVNLGDGSASAAFFSSRERAEEYMEDDDERYCEDIIDLGGEIEIDPVRYDWVDFQRDVKEYLESQGNAGALVLAEYLECGEGVVRSWAAGATRPRPLGVRNMIQEFILNRRRG